VVLLSGSNLHTGKSKDEVPSVQIEPLPDRRREKFSLLIAAGVDKIEAHFMAGYERDPSGSNASKVLKRSDVSARIDFLTGKEIKAEPLDLSPEAVHRKIGELAFDAKTPETVKARCLEYLAQAAKSGLADEHWPASAEDFDLARLSEKQKRLCELYAARMAAPRESPVDVIMMKLELLRGRQAA
jgi:hypothetical protein